MMKVGIIGVNGFIGLNLYNKLILNQSIDLHTFSRSKGKTTFKNFNFLDVKDFSEKKQILEKLDLIYYLVSSTIPSSSWETPLLEINDNLIPFLKLLDIISVGKCKKIIFISSAGAIYGDSENVLDETKLPNPFSPYGINKLTMEYYLNYYLKKYNLNYDCYRLSNVYGPGQEIKKGLGLINTLIEKSINNEDIEIYGKGLNIRNFIYIDDVIEIISNLSFQDLNQSNTINICSNDNVSIRSIIKIIEQVSNSKLSVNYFKERQSDILKVVLSNEALKRKISNITFTKLEIGIEKIYLNLKAEKK